MKFKAGDRVKVIGYDGPRYMGEVGVVDEKNTPICNYYVTFDDDDSEYFYEHELEAVPENN